MSEKSKKKSLFANSLLLHEGNPACKQLVIAFTGGAHMLMTNPFNFINVTGLYNKHFIIVSDPFRLWYQNGVNEKLTSFQQLCDYFKKKISQLNIEKVLLIGTSSGGYAALLAAHTIQADYAHAFGPQTDISYASLREASAKPIEARRAQINFLYQLHRNNKDNFDLRRAMRNYNGKTRYYIHYAADNPYDPQRALKMEKTPGVKIFPYPYKTHGIIVPMIETGYLKQLFLDKYLGDPGQIYDQYYGKEDKEIHPEKTDDTFVPEITIAKLIKNISLSKPDIERIRASKNILGEFGLDSIGTMRLVIELENAFAINIAIDEIEPGDFARVDKILDLVNRSTKSA
jgi:acyl carrier protein